MKIFVLPGNITTPKSYPHWDKFIALARANGHEVLKIRGTLEESSIIELINWCDVWISIDSFLQHLVHYRELKRGIVLWGTSDPLIFGYPANINLLKDRKYLRPQQFKWWREDPYTPEAFVSPEEVLQALSDMIDKNQ